MSDFSELVADERAAADMRWGHGIALAPELWLAVLTEEVGEVARAVLERDYPHMEQELAQVVAVAHRWMDAHRAG